MQLVHLAALLAHVATAEGTHARAGGCRGGIVGRTHGWGCGPRILPCCLSSKLPAVGRASRLPLPRAAHPLQGTFDSSTCRCKCQNEDINAAGYCRDPTTGRCTTQKVRRRLWQSSRDVGAPGAVGLPARSATRTSRANCQVCRHRNQASRPTCCNARNQQPAPLPCPLPPQGYDFTTKEYTCPSNATAAAPSGAPATGGGPTSAPANTAAQPLTIEMDVTGEFCCRSTQWPH